jgi:DNA-directed RNA polymerase subunit L
MEINILEQSKKRIMFELPELDHTFCNILKHELWHDKKVSAATYNIKHPLVGKPIFIVEVDEGDPKKVIIAACKKMHKMNDELQRKVVRIK